ncbi:hypothetical protein ACFZCU_45905 [Streptomyces canus]|uniref:hypothetical protein n=1 Tax=Streptomyces canus TaxID=58343 RepID=UPI0036EC252A
MSNSEAASLAIAIGLVLVAYVIGAIVRASAHVEELLAESPAPTDHDDGHDVGPDSLRLLKDLEAHMKAYGNEVADLYDTTTGD